MADAPKIPYANRGSALGELVTWELKEGEAKAKEGQDARPYSYVNGEVKVGDSRLRIAIWPTAKNATYHLDLYKKIQKGQIVSCHGFIEEQIDTESRVFRALRLYGMDVADQGAEHRLVYYVAGHLGLLEKVGGGEHPEQYVVPITITRVYKDAQGQEQQKDTTVRVHPTTEWLQAIYGPNSPLKTGMVVRARGDILNQIKTDRYGVVDGFDCRLTVAKFEKWNTETSAWETFLEDQAAQAATPGAPPVPGMTAAPAGSAAPAAQPQFNLQAKPAAPTAQPDDDVPF